MGAYVFWVGGVGVVCGLSPFWVKYSLRCLTVSLPAPGVKGLAITAWVAPEAERGALRAGPTLFYSFL